MLNNFKYLKKDEDDLTPLKKENLPLEYWEKTWMSKKNDISVFISCVKKTNLEILKNKLYETVKTIQKEKYPYNNFLY